MNEIVSWSEENVAGLILVVKQATIELEQYESKQKKHMEIAVLPLTDEDKKYIRRTVIGRLIVLFILILPLLLATLFILHDIWSNFLDQDYGFLTLIGIVFIAIMVYLVVPYFIPLYYDTYRNMRANKKEVIRTTVTRKDERWTRKGVRYFIETEFSTIDSWKNTILSPDTVFPHLQAGDVINIHIIPNNKYDLLKIEQLERKGEPVSNFHDMISQHKTV